MSNNPLHDLDPDSLRRSAKILLYRQNPELCWTREFKIATKGMGLLPFYPNAVQLPLLDAAKNQLKRIGKIRQVIFKCRQPGVCLAPSMRVLTADLRWVSLSKVLLGDNLVAIDENFPGGKGTDRKMRTCDVEVIRRLRKEAFKILLDNGIELIATAEHRFMFKRRGGCECQWRSVGETKIGDEIRYICTPWAEPNMEDAWFGGLLDGEGWARARDGAGIEVGVCQSPGAVLDRARKYLQDRGYTFYEGLDLRKPGLTSKLGKKTVHSLRVTRISEVFRLLGQTRTTRFNGKRLWDGKSLPGKRIGNAWTRVISIEPLGVCDMIDLQTSTKTFVCEGIVSHNSTFASGLGAWKTFFFDNVNTFVIAHDKDTVAHIFSMYDLMYDEMSTEIRPERIYYNKGSEMVFTNRSRIHVGEAKNINVGVGRTIHALHCTEVPRWPYTDPIGESLLPALSDYPGTLQIFEGTAHFAPGAEWFRDKCERAMAGDGDFEYFFVKWWKLPEYSIPLKKGEKLRLDVTERYLAKKYQLKPEQIKWRREKIKELKGDEDLFRLSYPFTYEEAWITKESEVFPHSRLMELRSMLRPPKKRFNITEGRLYENPEGEFSVWHEPEAGKIYFVGGDVAEGNVDGDWSVAQVIEQETNIQCGEYRYHLLPRPFGDVLAAIGRYYYNAQIAPEVNDCGRSTLDRLRDIYTNIYIWRKRDSVVPKLTNLLGWETTHNSKRTIVELTRELLWNRQLQIHSEVLWNEMKCFVRAYTPTGQITYSAARGFDDALMSYMIALQASDDENFGKKYAYQQHIVQAKPKEIVDDAYRDTEWLKIMSGGKSTYEDIVGSWE